MPIVRRPGRTDVIVERGHVLGYQERLFADEPPDRRGRTLIHDRITGERLQRTYPGMAGWAGGGPPGRTCRDCDHYQPTARDDREGLCNRYVRLTSARLG